MQLFSDSNPVYHRNPYQEVISPTYYLRTLSNTFAYTLLKPNNLLIFKSEDRYLQQDPGADDVQ